MYTRLFFAALMSMLLAWPSLADDQPAGNGAPKQNEKKDDKKPEKKEKRETYRHMGQLSGTIKDVSDVGRTITLEMRGAVPNFIPTHYWRGMIRGSYRVQQQSYDMDLVLADDVKVRLPAKPEYDEKGRPKKAKPDPEDKDSNLGGTKGSDSDLARRQQVIVNLGMTTSDPRNQRVVVTSVIVVSDVPGRDRPN